MASLFILISPISISLFLVAFEITNFKFSNSNIFKLAALTFASLEYG